MGLSGEQAEGFALALAAELVGAAVAALRVGRAAVVSVGPAVELLELLKPVGVEQSELLASEQVRFAALRLAEVLASPALAAVELAAAAGQLAAAAVRSFAPVCVLLMPVFAEPSRPAAFALSLSSAPLQQVPLLPGRFGRCQRQAFAMHLLCRRDLRTSLMLLMECHLWLAISLTVFHSFSVFHLFR